jgi:hypothetical protein
MTQGELLQIGPTKFYNYEFPKTATYFKSQLHTPQPIVSSSYCIHLRKSHADDLITVPYIADDKWSRFVNCCN